MTLARWFASLPLRLRALFHRGQLDAELDEELAYHLDRRIELEVAQGHAPAEARARALRQLGSPTALKEQARDRWSWTLLEVLLQDLRFAARSLRQSPGFAATAVCTLALGIGASTAIFSVVNSVLLQPLSFRESNRLVALWEHIPVMSAEPAGPNELHVDLLARAWRSIEGVSTVSQGAVAITQANARPISVGIVAASPNLFDLLRVKPWLGRTFGPEHGVEGQDRVIVLTHSFWQTYLRGDRNILGQIVRLGDIPRTVIGVLPPDFHYPNSNEFKAFQRNRVQTGVLQPAVFAPLVLDLRGLSWTGNFGNRVMIARLRPGVSLSQAQAEIDGLVVGTLLPRIASAIGGNNGLTRPGALRVLLEPLQDVIVGRSRTTLWFLLAAVLGLMLIACVNLANTQLARSLSRLRESGVRGALGAPRWRIVWMVLAENLLLCFLGGLSGVVLAHFALRLLQAQSLVHIPRLAEVQLHSGVLVFSLVLILGAAAFFSLFPVLRFLKQDPQSALSSGNQRVFGSQSGRRTQGLLVMAQVFGCTVLLLVTALFAKNLFHILGQDRGFASGNVVLAQVNLTGAAYGPAAARATFIDNVLVKLQQIPGQEAAGFTSAMPLEGESWIEPLYRAGQTERDASIVNLRFTSSGYFPAMGHRLVAGRFLEDADRDRKNAVLSEGLAKLYWPNGDAVGGQVHVSGALFTVVGVIADSSVTSLKDAPTRLAFVPYAFRNPGRMFFVVRANRPASELTPLVREAIWSHAPDVAIPRVKSLDSQVRESLGSEHAQTAALAAFGLAALLLAMIGIYGVLSYLVATRKQEIGVRLALGASRRQIVNLTFGALAVPVLAGLALGVAASLAASEWISRIQFGAKGFDPSLVASIGALFLIAAGFAALIPARRAASLDPVASLRAD